MCNLVTHLVADIKYSGHFSGAKQIKFMHIYICIKWSKG